MILMAFGTLGGQAAAAFPAAASHAGENIAPWAPRHERKIIAREPLRRSPSGGQGAQMSIFSSNPS